MNTYLVPTTAAGSVYPYDCILLVHANTSEEAYTNAKLKLIGKNIPLESSEYECYPFELCTSDYFEYPFHESRKYDILNETFKRTEGYEHMGHFQVNWNDYTDALAKKAEEENWTNAEYPNNGILTNYLVHTYKKLSAEKAIIRKKDYGIFNTGLFTTYHDPIYAYSNNQYKIQFLTGYELDAYGIEDRPNRANYFEKPELLVFDWHFPIDIQFEHILDNPENQKRLPAGFLNQDNKVTILTGAIQLMKNKVSSNYKLAIPQYYDGKIQLLLPLCLDSDDGKPNLALAVTKLDTCYQGHTCLTLDMAYNNARLIAKPESNWLFTEDITNTKEDN